MAHWVDTYPHEVYASVLLLDNKIYNYKIGQHYWEYPFQVKMRYSDFDKLDKMEAKYTSFTVENDEEHENAFRIHAREWFKQWEIHKENIGSKPY
ncbi:hypothetical protein [Metabacillus arenae]|uniref:Uncharacterized protein n=1 Tax=Metabacillus arenae TaxID=2771434 RepID=A0A926NFN3_9BACI|nr:hypothetical protein [Metabacillus arenae]MBD1379133.1 hypothetical protein [Metabacillus arenae]